MATAITMPQLGLTMTEGTIGVWAVKEGDAVAVGDALVTVETDKLTSTVESEVAGTVLAIVAKEGAEVPVQGLLCVIGLPGEAYDAKYDGAENGPAAEAAPASALNAGAAPVPAASLAGAAKRIRISPLAKKIAAANGVDCGALTGSGPGGRIVQKDVLAAVAGRGSLPAPALPGGRREKLSRMRAAIGERMAKSHAEIPAVTHTVKIDVTELLALRARVNEGRETPFSINDFILKAVAKALARRREMLVSLDNGEVVFHDEVHIGMAVALETGLIVPVIRRADTLGLEALSLAARDLASRARAGTLAMEEYEGSTFSVSNLGMYRVESFTPIINQPNAAILGVCEIQDELALADGAVVVKKIMRHCLSYDHRLMDGAGAAAFQMTVKSLLENPLRILL